MYNTEKKLKGFSAKTIEEIQDQVDEFLKPCEDLVDLQGGIQRCLVVRKMTGAFGWSGSTAGVWLIYQEYVEPIREDDK